MELKTLKELLKGNLYRMLIVRYYPTREVMWILRKDIETTENADKDKWVLIGGFD